MFTEPGAILLSHSHEKSCHGAVCEYGWVGRQGIGSRDSNCKEVGGLYCPPPLCVCVCVCVCVTFFLSIWEAGPGPLPKVYKHPFSWEFRLALENRPYPCNHIPFWLGRGVWVGRTQQQTSLSGDPWMGKLPSPALTGPLCPAPTCLWWRGTGGFLLRQI